MGPHLANPGGGPPRSGNAGLTYNYLRWNLRLMWNYADTYLASLNAGDPSSSEFIGRRGQFDFFTRFKISRNLNVFLDAIDLLEENRGRYRNSSIACPLFGFGSLISGLSLEGPLRRSPKPAMPAR